MRAHRLPKAEAARRHLERINSSVRVQAKVADLVPENVEDLLRGADVVLDGTDNFETRYLINDFCVREGLPWIYAAAVGCVCRDDEYPAKPGARAQGPGFRRRISSFSFVRFLTLDPEP
jgi:hypothetical protein